MSNAAPSPATHRPAVPLTREREIQVFALLIVAAVALFSLGLGRTGFQGTDENRYTQVAKEIGGDNNPFVMHLYGELYPDKPPVFFWMIKASFLLLGEVSPLAARLPLFLTTLLTLLLAYLAMRQIQGPRLALWSLVLLMLSFRFVWAGRWLRLDMPLMMFVCGAFWASARLLLPREDQKPAGLGIALFGWGMMTLATLTKGTGLPVWVGAIATYALWRRDMGVIRVHRPVAGILFSIAIAALWVVPAWVYGGPYYLGSMMGTHALERYVGEVQHNAWIGYYFTKILYDGFPTSVLLPPALVWAWRRRKDPALRPRIKFLLAWFGFTFVFFSICHGKRSQYILPLYPAMAMMIAQMLDEIELGIASARMGKWARGHLWVLVAVMMIGAAAALPLRTQFPGDFEMSPPLPLLMVAVMALGGSGLVAASFLLRRRARAALVAALIGFFAIHLMIFGLYFPNVYGNEVSRAVAERIEAENDDHAIVGLYGYKDSFLVYGNIRPRPFKGTESLREFEENPDARWLVAAAEDRDKVMRTLDDQWQEVEKVRDQLVSEDFLILRRNRPGADGS